MVCQLPPQDQPLYCRDRMFFVRKDYVVQPLTCSTDAQLQQRIDNWVMHDDCF